MIKINIPLDLPKKISRQDLIKVQSRARTTISFSLTLNCPNNCQHCLVNAGANNEEKSISMRTALNYSSQMLELYENGINYIGFTGGEPIMVKKPLKVMSDSAANVGLNCGIVTSCYWAINELKAKKIIDYLNNINIWDISVDSYHQKFVSLNNIKIAYELLKKSDKDINIRFTKHNPSNEEDNRILSFINSFADEEDITFQTLRNQGRGQKIKIQDIENNIFLNRPCLTAGLVVRHDGSISPCCVSFAEERNHPFQFGNAHNKPLTEIYKDFMTNPVIQMIRTVGFKNLYNWINEKNFKIKTSYNDICYFCYDIFTNPNISEYILNRANESENKLKIAILCKKFFNEDFMLNNYIKETNSNNIHSKGVRNLLYED